MQVNKHHSADFTRVFDLLEYQCKKYPNTTALNAFVDNAWQSYSIHNVKERALALACWFVREGFTPGEKIMLVPLAGNPLWVILDFACQQAGLVVVPVHPTSHDDEIELILAETETRLCVTADTVLASKIKQVALAANKVADVFHTDQQADGFFQPLHTAIADAATVTRVAQLCGAITPHDVVSILYTSGSSGMPKGVMLTHSNIVHNIKAVLMLPPLQPEQRVISFLPFSHILERVACYTYIAFGVSVYFSEQKENFTRDFNSVKPYFCTCVPRVLEKMYGYMQEQLLQRNWVKRNTIAWALTIGKRYGSTHKLEIWYALKLAVARLLVLRLWRKKLGGKIKYMVVGAASLQPEIGRLFSAAGITIVEGYGMTETAPLISVNRFEPGLNHFGTVGLPIAGVDVKIDEPNEHHEGEIVVKGPNIMKGYFKRPELTASVFSTDGWFRTGDVGKFVHGKFLKITDRKKDIFKTSTGKYISPQPLQNHFCKSPFIQQCLAIGFQRPFVTALLVPDFELLQRWCQQKDIHWTSPPFMVHNIKVRGFLQHEVDKLNELLPGYQRIRNFIVCPVEWSVENNELTNTLKPIRKNLEQHYQKEIEKMYY
jgi:long-chain acyl-CoA synthetase